MTLRFNKKSLYKAISWRILSIGIGYLISYWILQSFSMAGKLTLAHSIVGTILYYFHERFWAVVRKKKWINI